MTQTANNYGTVLFELGITKEIVEKTKEIFELTSELPRVLNCPVVSRKEKHRMIERFFPQEIHHFLKELCDHEHMDVIEDVFAAYQNCYDEKNGILRAKMQCAEVPDETQLAQIRNYLAGIGSAKLFKNPFVPFFRTPAASIKMMLISASAPVTPTSFVGDFNPNRPIILANPI